MNKLDVTQALTRLESQALHWEGYHGRGAEKPIADARLVRRWIAAERQEILILRRYVLWAANELEDLQVTASKVAELRGAAKPKRKVRK